MEIYVEELILQGYRKENLKAIDLVSRKMDKLYTRNNVTEARIENVDGNTCGGAYSIRIQQNIIESLLTWYQDKGTSYILETNVTEARGENIDGNVCGGVYSIGIQKRKLKAYQLGIKTKGQTIYQKQM